VGEHPAYASVGRIRRAHGVRGELAVEVLTDAPDAFFAPGARLFVGTPDGSLLIPPGSTEPRTVIVEDVRPFQEAILLTLESIVDKTEADKWRGRHLLVPFDELEAPADGEVFLHELAGMHVIDAAGAPIGTVRDWYQLPNGLLLDIATPTGVKSFPYNEAFVKHVDRTARTMTVEIPDGLFD
jgi:16S rRNA processing protein RimM